MNIANIIKSKYTVKDQTAKQFVYEDVSEWADWGLDLATNTIDVTITTPSDNVLNSQNTSLNGTHTFDLPSNVLETGDYALKEIVTLNEAKITMTTINHFTIKGDWTTSLSSKISMNDGGTNVYLNQLEEPPVYSSVTRLTTVIVSSSTTVMGFTPTQISFCTGDVITPLTYTSEYTYSYAQFASISEAMDFTSNCDASTLTVVDNSTYIATISQGVTNTPTSITHVSHIAYYPPSSTGASSVYNGGANKTIVIPVATDGNYTIIKQSTVTYTILDTSTYNIVLVVDILVNTPYILACTNVMDTLCQCFYNLVKRWEEAMLTDPRYADKYMKQIILVLAYDHLYNSAIGRGCTTYVDFFAGKLVQLLGGCGCGGATTTNPPININPCNQ